MTESERFHQECKLSAHEYATYDAKCNFYSSESKVDYQPSTKTQLINADTVNNETIRNGILLTSNIKTESWDENDSILYVPYLNNNCYTPIVTSLELFKMSDRINSWFKTLENVTKVSETPKTFVYSSEIAKSVPQFDDFQRKRINHYIHQTFISNGSNTIHLHAFLIMHKMLIDDSRIGCHIHSTSACFTCVDGLFNYNITDEKGEIDNSQCDQCKMLYVLGYVFGYLQNGKHNMTVASMFELNGGDNIEENAAKHVYKIYLGVKESVSMPVSLALKVACDMSVNDIVENLSVFMYMRRNVSNKIRCSNEATLDSTRVSCFHFKSAVRVLIAGMYLAAKSVDETAKIVSIDYASNVNEKMSKNGRLGRLAIRVSAEDPHILKVLQVFVVTFNAKSLLENGMTSFSIYLAVSSANKDAVKDKTLVENSKLRSPNANIMLKSDFYGAMHLLPCSMLIWESNRIYTIISHPRSVNEMSYIEAKISYPPYTHMENVDMINATGFMLRQIMKLLGSEGVYCQHLDRSDTETRLRIAPINGDVHALTQLLSFPLSKKFRLGDDGYINKAFKHMYDARKTPINYPYPDQVAVNLTICNKTTGSSGEPVMLNFITPTSVIYLDELISKHRNKNNAVLDGDEV